MIWWLIWIIPLWIGWRMYREDTGLEWARTLKIDANATLVRALLEKPVPARVLLRKPLTRPQLTARPEIKEVEEFEEEFEVEGLDAQTA